RSVKTPPLNASTIVTACGGKGGAHPLSRPLVRAAAGGNRPGGSVPRGGAPPAPFRGYLVAAGAGALSPATPPPPVPARRSPPRPLTHPPPLPPPPHPPPTPPPPPRNPPSETPKTASPASGRPRAAPGPFAALRHVSARPGTFSASPSYPLPV